MRLYLISTLAVTLSWLHCEAANTSFTTDQSVISRHEPEESFRRIQEYFTGVETYKNRILFRSDEASRAGYYWIIRPTESLRTLPEGSKIELQYQAPQQRSRITREYVIKKPKLAHSIYIGETGHDKIPEGKHPLAWKIRISSPLGVELFSRQSYLWSYPEAN